MHARENALKEWIASIIKSKDFVLSPLYGDASFRKYYRLQHNGKSSIVMDAPPGKEDLDPFIHIAQILANQGVTAPTIIAENKLQGFLLLSDFGDNLLLNALTSETVNRHYQQAITVLLQMQQCPSATLPAFDTQHMVKEMNLCWEWFLKGYLALDLNAKEEAVFNDAIHFLAAELAQQPQVFIHRDYHSRNLMLIEDGQLGVIDFQDAMHGPITYDLVSLLKDCYISWPRELMLQWVELFYNQSELAQKQSLEQFIRAFDLCGLQRHIKVLGVFSRLKLRDNKAGYIKDLPLTLNYALDCSESYPELRPFNQLLLDRVSLP